MPIDRNRLKLPPAGLASWPEGIGTGSSRPCGHADQPEPARATACRPRQLAGEDRHQQQPDMRTCRSAGAGSSYRLPASPTGRRGSAPAAPGHADRPISWNRLKLLPAGHPLAVRSATAAPGRVDQPAAARGQPTGQTRYVCKVSASGTDCRPASATASKWAAHIRIAASRSGKYSCR